MENDKRQFDEQYTKKRMREIKQRLFLVAYGMTGIANTLTFLLSQSSHLENQEKSFKLLLPLALANIAALRSWPLFQEELNRNED